VSTLGTNIVFRSLGNVAYLTWSITGVPVKLGSAGISPI
jgi:hypothetical protein